MTDSAQSDEQPIQLHGRGQRESAPVIRQSAAAFREIVRALAPDPHCNPQCEPVVFDASTTPLMRAVVARYGFDRLPLTLAEFFGLFEYCDTLDAASGIGMRPPDQLADWQAASFEVWRRKKPALMPAIKHYCLGNIEGLKALHGAEDTLTRLGREYLRPED